MIHYHGLPITPATAAVKAVETGHAFNLYFKKQGNQMTAAQYLYEYEHYDELTKEMK